MNRHAARFILLLVAVLASECVLRANFGETPAQVSRRYGTAIKEQLSRRNSHVRYSIYWVGDRRINVEFMDGKGCGEVIHARASKSSFPDKQRRCPRSWARQAEQGEGLRDIGQGRGLRTGSSPQWTRYHQERKFPIGETMRGASLRWFSIFCLLAFSATGCYRLRPSNGAGKTTFSGERRIDESSVAVLPQYRVNAIANRLTFPTGVTFDGDGRPCVVESGYAYGEKWTTPRLLRVEDGGRVQEIAAGGRNGPWTGVTFHDGNFYVAEGGELEGGRILRISSDGSITVLVSNLPSFGDHHTDGPVVGPDGWLYFGQGTASNSGIVGEDNAKFGWLKRHPEFHDVPGQDVVLTGHNVTTRDFIGDRGKVNTGAYLPFGMPSQPGQVIKGQVPCSGSIMRVHPEGGQIELVAWGLRNPFGLAFLGDQLYVTENGYDQRGSRPVWGAPDYLWKIDKGAWYGWPDFSGGVPLTDKRFKMKGGFVIQNHPSKPPYPVAAFGVHSSADGFDFSRNPAFGHVGEAFVALFGDEAPTVGKVLDPVGAKVVRVNLQNGVIEDFAVNRGPKSGPASRVGGGGLERPVAARFNPHGDALYVVDFGVMTQDKKGAHPVERTGVLWRIAGSGVPAMTGRAEPRVK